MILSSVLSGSAKPQHGGLAVSPLLPDISTQLTKQEKLNKDATSAFSQAKTVPELKAVQTYSVFTHLSK